MLTFQDREFPRKKMCVVWPKLQSVQTERNSPIFFPGGGIFLSFLGLPKNSGEKRKKKKRRTWIFLERRTRKTKQPLRKDRCWPSTTKTTRRNFFFKSQELSWKSKGLRSTKTLSPWQKESMLIFNKTV